MNAVETEVSALVDKELAAAKWFSTRHPPGPAAREMYKMAAAALKACAVIGESLSPREEFDNDEEYIDYLISVIHGLETIRQRQREMITALEQKLAD